MTPKRQSVKMPGSISDAQLKLSKCQLAGKGWGRGEVSEFAQQINIERWRGRGLKSESRKGEKYIKKEKLPREKGIPNVKTMMQGKQQRETCSQGEMNVDILNSFLSTNDYCTINAE